MFSKTQNKSDVALSKRLSYLLRHGATKESLNIKPNGFIAVNELLNTSLHQYTIDDIKRVVKENNKQRFTLETINGILEIKANQGHSIFKINELSLKILDCIDFDVIHGTYFKYWPNIRTEGLSRMKRNHIHFAKGLNFVNGLRQNAELFIYVNFGKAKEDGLIFFESENGVVLCAGNSKGFIETKYFLKVITADGQTLNLN
ncbi:tRNA 2'-phosphotransferase 1 isoform X2 [Mycetomoellerius zeteki]|uniref:tRNA 2'-phosphotransferase 1 isoform X2 n=1 Tax=Mycetomoellerius zeteki TaxID=64791 RepID=UPI00084E4816|nr:PREDICTED: tRNA 2'-phosphotransferase 1 isoform X2 [Trachymyrmex zeteki]